MFLDLLYQDEAHLYMLTEALMGGELFTLLCTHDTFDAATARFYLAQVWALLVTWVRVELRASQVSWP